MLKGAKFVEYASQRPNVTFVVVRLFFTKLRAQIIWSSNNRMSHVLSLIQKLSHTEISNLDLVVFAQEHVDRFNISMQDLICMKVPQPKTHLYEKLPQLAFIQWPSHLLFQILAEITIFAVFHDDVDRIFFHKRIVVPNTVLALDFGHDRSL